MFNSASCLVALNVLTAAPYSLTQGQYIIVKVIAPNFYGNSLESLQSDGAENSRIVLVPDAPFSLAN